MQVLSTASIYKNFTNNLIQNFKEIVTSRSLLDRLTATGRMQPCAQKSVRSSDRFIQLYHRCYLTLFSQPWRKVKVSNVTRHKDNVRTELHGKRSLLLSLVVLVLLSLAIFPFSLPFFTKGRSCLNGSGFRTCVFWDPFGERECWSMIS